MSTIFLNEDFDALKGGVGFRLKHDVTGQVHRADDVLPLGHVHDGEVVGGDVPVHGEGLYHRVVQDGVRVSVVLVGNPLVLKLNGCLGVRAIGRKIKL